MVKNVFYILFFLSFISFSQTIYCRDFTRNWGASCQNITPLTKQYHCYRYRYVANGNSQNYIDMAEVQSIYQDYYNLEKPDAGTLADKQWVVVLKSGRKLLNFYSYPNSNILDSFLDYIDFMGEHPEFLSYR